MLDVCLNKLKQERLRSTKNRRVLLQILHNAPGPLAPPEMVKRVHAAGRPANKTTVYRELERLVALGIVKRVIVSDRKQYFELTERGHHHHFVCLACHTVQDIEIPETGLLREAERLGKELTFTIETHAVEFYGRCQQCLAV